MVIQLFDSNACITCGDSISDPVCRSCYIKQVDTLLNNFEIPPIANEMILKKIKNKFTLESLNETKCVLCQRENVSMCRHCFSIILINILKELNFPDNLIENFGFNPIHEEIYLGNKSFQNKNFRV